MIYGYVRGSDDRIDLENQYMVLTEWGVQRIDIYADTLTGAISPLERPGWHRLDATLVDGDTVVVTELQRIGRARRFIPDVLQDFHRRGIKLKSLAPGQEWTDYIGDKDPMKAMVGEILALFAGFMAEAERNDIIRRTKAGQARARARGKKIGGGHFKHLPEIRAEIRRDRRGGLSWAKLAAKWEISISTAKRYVKETPDAE